MDTQSAQSELSDDTHVEERGKEGNVATLSSNGLKNIYCQPSLYQLGFYNFPEEQLEKFAAVATTQFLWKALPFVSGPSALSLFKGSHIFCSKFS